MLILGFVLCLCPAVWAGPFVPDTLLLDELNDFNRSSLAAWGMNLAFDTSVDSADVETIPFKTDFQKAWGDNITPGLVTSLKGSQVYFREKDQRNYVPQSGKIVRPGVYLYAPVPKWGNLLAMRYSWNYTWAELGELLGGEVTERPEVSRLFEALTVVFTTTTGEEYAVVGTNGVDAAAAETNGALMVWENSTGVTITLNVCLANVQNQNKNQAPRIIDEKLLVVPDGTVDLSIDGTLWIVEKRANSNKGTPSSSSGGGGCNAGLGGVALIMAGAAFLCRRYSR